MYVYTDKLDLTYFSFKNYWFFFKELLNLDHVKSQSKFGSFSLYSEC